MPGVLYISETSAILRTRGDQIGRPREIDLRTMKFASVSDNNRVVEVREWRLWLSQADRDRPNAEPFFTFKARGPGMLEI